MPSTDPEVRRKWYKEHGKEAARRHRLKTRAFVNRYKNVPCQDCGIQYPYYVMDFDHRDPKDKEFTMSTAIVSNMSRARLLAEISKCDVVCANCHRERTHGPNGQRAKASALTTSA